MPGTIVCRPKSLPVTKLASAARRSIDVNPANAVESRQVVRTPSGRRGGPRRLAILIGRKWRVTGLKLSVQFLDAPERALRARILKHMNAWAKTANVKFAETRGMGQVRISRLDEPEDMAGYWSYIGTEILEVEDDQPTLNLEGFTMKTRDSEFRRVVRHEAGHTLGFEHEHMRGPLVKKIDPARAYAYFDRTNGWSRREVDAQVLTPLSERSIMGTTEMDPLSIMCYEIPGDITRDGKPIVGGSDITKTDYAFAASMYPKRVSRPVKKRR